MQQIMPAKESQKLLALFSIQIQERLIHPRATNKGIGIL
jgi:hypothetical protein